MRLLVLDSCPESMQRVVPLRRDLRQVPAHFVDSLWFELPNTFSAPAFASDQARFVKCVQVFCNALAGYIRAFSEFAYRKRAAYAKFLDDLQTRFVTERGKNRRNAHACG